MAKKPKNSFLRRRVKIIAALFVCILVALGVIEILNSIPYDVKVLDLHVTVDGKLGFNLDKDKVYFGKVTPENSGTRDVILEHSYNSSLRVKLFKDGEISNWVSIGTNDFLLNPSEKKNVPLTVTVPENTQFGNYTGTLKIVFYYT